MSILIFFKPIYNWFYIKNQALDFIWKLNAVSIAAQLLTTPFSIYHFHQFPNFFLLTNFIAVPLSSIIVLGEIFLCAVSFIPFMGVLSGKILSWLIWLMNSYIERIEALPYSLWAGMQIGVVQAVLLIFVVAGVGYWLLEKQKTGVWAGIFSLLFFTYLRCISFYQSARQKKIIVYNIPTEDFARNFHINPSRVLHRMEPFDHIQNFSRQENFLQWNRKRILLIDKKLIFDSCAEKIPIDLLIISKNLNSYLSRLSKTFTVKQVIFDGSVPESKIKYWVKDCESFHIPYWNVHEKGAFAMSLN